jgi:TATA-binding protein-associated factor
LFEDFAKKEVKAIQSAAEEKSREGKQHIFQALQYMRKLCNSPALVVKEGHKQYNDLTKQLARQNSSLRDIAHAPKLTALKDLLVDCGIGAADVGDQAAIASGEVEAVSQHRALIFCQMKEMLDMVQTEVLQKLLPSVQYLRLDGSVEANKRQDIVNHFNSDPSYDVLLLTTSVGGLGLNLTGADTVIFVEHDWNPQKDMQAMDRAHRIGQKKVVNVYRIVTRGTLEEKILRYVISITHFHYSPDIKLTSFTVSNASKLTLPPPLSTSKMPALVPWKQIKFSTSSMFQQAKVMPRLLCPMIVQTST